MNVGVLAVSSVLSSTAIAAGVGLGLFGVLSIIRLRSTELEQLLIARVHRVVVQRLDLVNDTTTVEARFEVARSSAARNVKTFEPVLLSR